MKTATSRGIREILQDATRQLTDADIPDGRREAEVIMAHVLKKERLDLYRNDTLVLDEGQQEAFAGWIRRRVRREPLQYILGTQEFWGLEFSVTSDCLIPRPESEHLIESIIESVPQFFVHPMKPFTAVDLGTGSGCLAVTLAKIHPTCLLLAVDVSPLALEVARSNAGRNGVADRIQFVEGDFLKPLTEFLTSELSGHQRKVTPDPQCQAISGLNGAPDRRVSIVEFDLFVCNPPYVPTAEVARLQPEVGKYEPRLALDGGPDGLQYYRQLVPSVSNHLRAGGLLILEIGIGQADPVCQMALRSGWRVERVKRDLAGIERVVVLRKT